MLVFVVQLKFWNQSSPLKKIESPLVAVLASENFRKERDFFIHRNSLSSIAEKNEEKFRHYLAQHAVFILLSVLSAETTRFLIVSAERTVKKIDRCFLLRA